MSGYPFVVSLSNHSGPGQSSDNRKALGSAHRWRDVESLTLVPHSLQGLGRRRLLGL